MLKPRQIFQLVVAIFVLFVLLSWCAAERDTAFLIMFGRNIGETGFVSDADWAEFEKTEVAPALRGYTLLQGRGGYLPKDTVSEEKAALDQEQTIILFYVTDDPDPAREAINDLAEQYKEQFFQKSVMIIQTEADILEDGYETSEEGSLGRFLIIATVLTLVVGAIIGLIRYREEELWR